MEKKDGCQKTQRKGNEQEQDVDKQPARETAHKSKWNVKNKT